MQYNVLLRLFKSYCCSFYGSNLWDFNSSGFDRICKNWNVAIRILLQLPRNAHSWVLGPLLSQDSIKNQFYIRNYRFLFTAIKSCNTIVNNCMTNALYNSNSYIGSKIAFYRYHFNLDIFTPVKIASKVLCSKPLNNEQKQIISNVKTLLSVRTGTHDLDNISYNDIKSATYGFSGFAALSHLTS